MTGERWEIREEYDVVRETWKHIEAKGFLELKVMYTTCIH